MIKQMSKIYNKYLELKSQNKENTLFLFKYGIFFIFIDNDAKIVSSLLNLKLGKLNENIVKCGFPITSLEKYSNLLNDFNFSVEIVSSNDEKTLSSSNFLYYEKTQKVVDELVEINIDSLSISQAYELLYKLQKELILMRKEFNYEES